MPSLLLTAAIAVAILYVGNYYLCFARNLRAAKASGIQYVISPVFMLNRFWLVTHNMWLPYLQKLPKKWTHPWIDYCYPEWTWDAQYGGFARMGADTFLVVSPGGNHLWTADPSVISQITNRRNDFPKPIHIYKSVDIYGKNVVSTEGNHWRQHRKITSPPFTEKNNYMVWQESLHTAKSMVTSWVGKDGNRSHTVERVADDSMRLSLHVISQAGFGVKLLWPGVEDEDDTPSLQAGAASKISNNGFAEGHTMSYTYALHTLLANILLVMLTPHWILKNAPFKFMRRAHESYTEWGNYMQEMYNAKKGEFKSGADPSTTRMDLMGALVKGAGVVPDTSNGSANGSAKASKAASQALTDQEILGNAFVFILAGHETAANSIHFSILNLALNPVSQRRLQKDLDSIFRGKPVSEWDYDRDLPHLFGGMAGAVMNEELRLVPPVMSIPKCTHKPQTLTIDGKTVTVPGDSYVSLISVAVQRNPKYWPHGPPSDPKKPVHPSSNVDNDLEEFKPERWLLDEKKQATNGNMPGDDEKSAETDDLGVNTAADTSASLYRPPKGAYIPFSEGYRSCLGRRFAQVEILAVIAVIFSQYTVELAVDEYATDEEVEKMTTAERKVVWEKAAGRAKWLMRHGMGTIITLQMRAGHVPLRVVKKGSERFSFA